MIQSGTGARVTLFDDKLAPQVNPDVDLPVDPGTLSQALGRATPVEVIEDSDLLVAQPLTIGGRRYVLAARKHLAYVQEATRVVGAAICASRSSLLILPRARSTSAQPSTTPFPWRSRTPANSPFLASRLVARML